MIEFEGKWGMGRTSLLYEYECHLYGLDSMANSANQHLFHDSKWRLRKENGVALRKKVNLNAQKMPARSWRLVDSEAIRPLAMARK